MFLVTAFNKVTYYTVVASLAQPRRCVSFGPAQHKARIVLIETDDRTLVSRVFVQGEARSHNEPLIVFPGEGLRLYGELVGRIKLHIIGLTGKPEKAFEDQELL